MNDNRIVHHQILGNLPEGKWIKIDVDGKKIKAREGETIAAALIAAGIKVFRYSVKRNEPRGLFCAIGRCTDCVMTVDNRPNVRTCVTLVENGMRIEIQKGLGERQMKNEKS
jgi:predicted molibdopterin-dependent oxidoreductase YjgC